MSKLYLSLLPNLTKSMPRIFLFLVVFLCCSGRLTTAADDPSAESVPSTPVKVETTTARMENIGSRVEVVGTVQAVDQAVIAAKISGIIVDIPVVLGSRVSKGDLLVKINADEISARVLQAQAQLAQAQRNLEREEKLLKQKASTPETVKSMRDMLAIAEAGYREAASMLDYTTISAPFTGVITKKIANSGDLATPGMPLLHLENPEQLQVVASIPETLALRIKKGDHLAIYVPADNSTHEGVVAETSPVINPLSRTSEIKINLAGPSLLRTGMFAKVLLPVTETTTLMVPSQAIVPFGQLEKVFVVHGDKAELRLVRSGRRTKDMTEILSGLQAGEQVVTANNHLLVNGQPIVIAK